MMEKIDIAELSVRESERIEWKDQVADTDDVTKTIVAFSNDLSNLGGGYVVCGAKEVKDENGFPNVDFVGLRPGKLKEVENKVLDDCKKKVDPPVVPLVEEIVPPESTNRVLVFVVPSTGQAHSYRARSKDSSTYYIRMGRRTIEARNGLLRELLSRKRVLEPWDRRKDPRASESEVDLSILRDYLREMGMLDQSKDLQEYLKSDSQFSSFVPPLVDNEPLTDEIRPRNFTLLMFGKTPTRFFPGAYSIFSVYRGIDRSESTAERRKITGTLVEQIRKLIELLNTEAYVVFDKDSPIPNQAKYPIRALKEAVVNALVHRDL